MPRRVLRTVAVRTKGEEIRFENLSVAHARSAVAEIRAKDHVVCGGIGVSCRGNHADAGLLEHVARHAAGKSILHSKPLMVLQNRIDESHARFTVASSNFSRQKNGYAAAQCVSPNPAAEKRKHRTAQSPGSTGGRQSSIFKHTTVLQEEGPTLGEKERESREIQLTLIDLRFGKIGVVTQGCT